MIGWALDKAVSWILDAVRDTLNLIWKLLASTLFHLPDVTGLPQVQTLAARGLLVVNTGYVLVIIVTGLLVMTQGSLQIRYGAGELLPRLVIGLGAANFATPICVALITVANALVQALTGRGIASTDTLQQLLRMITQQLHDPVAALLSAVIGVILVVLVVMLIIGWITRFFLLVVLCGIAPVALACHGSPWSEGAAQLWWRSMGGVCVTVVLQAVALNTSLSILLDPQANLAGYGLPLEPSGLLNLVIVAVLLWFTVRIPSLVHRYLSATGNRPNLVGALVRLVIAQQVTRGFGTALRGAVSTVGASRGSHTSAGRHLGGGSRGRTGASKQGTGNLPLGAPQYSRGSHGELGRHVSGSTRGRSGQSLPAPQAQATPGPSNSPPNSPTAAGRWAGPAGPGMTTGPWPAHRTGIGWPGSPAGPGAARRSRGPTGWPGTPDPPRSAPAHSHRSHPTRTTGGGTTRPIGTGWPAPPPQTPSPSARSTGAGTPGGAGGHRIPPRNTGPRWNPPNRSTP
jgi:hypothetical protein